MSFSNELIPERAKENIDFRRFEEYRHKIREKYLERWTVDTDSKAFLMVFRCRYAGHGGWEFGLHLNGSYFLFSAVPEITRIDGDQQQLIWKLCENVHMKKEERRLLDIVEYERKVKNAEQLVPDALKCFGYLYDASKFSQINVAMKNA